MDSRTTKNKEKVDCDNSYNATPNKKAAAKIALLFIMASIMLILPDIASADLYLNSQTGNIYLNTTNAARMQIAPGGNLILLGQANVSFPANLTVDSGTLFVDSVNNRAGIGTLNPINALTIIGDVSAFGSLNATYINATQIRQNGNLVQTVESAFNLGNVSNDTLRISNNATISLWNKSGNNIFNREFGGNVGIGTTAPAATLDVKGKANFTGNFSVGQTSNIFFVDNTSGNVGIGTTTPSEKLTVIGNVNISKDVKAGNFTIEGSAGSLYQPVYGTDDGLVLYLPFSEGNDSMGSNKVYDRSPYGNDGTCSGVSAAYGCNWTTGKYGNALQFDGVDDYVNAGTITPPDSITIESWIYINSLPASSDSDTIVGWKDSTASTQTQLYIFKNGATSELRYFIWKDGSNNAGWLSTYNFSTQNWYHIAMTQTLPSNTPIMFINGVSLSVSQFTVSGTPSHSYSPLSIGRLGDENGNYFNGTIDEVKIYKRALSPEEIRTSYLRGKGFGATGAITADKFRVVNTSGAKTLELNATAFDVKAASGSSALYVHKTNANVGIGTASPNTKLEVNGTATIGGDLNIPSNNLNVGGGYSSGGVSLIGTGADKGSGQFAKDIMIDGAIVAVYDVEINKSFIPIKDIYSILGNVTNRFLDLFVTNIKAGNVTLNVTGNVSIARDTLFVDNTSGYVGIGTAAPAAKLEIQGGNSDTTGTNQALRFNNFGFREGATTSAVHLDTYTGSAWISTLTVKRTDGNVGIGQTSPNVTLGVSGSANITGTLTVVKGANITGGIRVSELISCDTINTDATGNLFCGVDAGGSGDIRNSTSWNRTGTNVLLANQDDKVGIGDIAPSEKLSVIGNVNASGTILASNFTITHTNGSLYQPVYGTDDGLVLYLPFSENAINVSNRTYDRSPYGNDGTLTNMNNGDANNGTWANGKYGYGMSFDGVDDYVDAGSGASLNITNVITVEAWINPKSTGGGGFGRILSKGGTTDGYEWYLRETSRVMTFRNPNGFGSIDSTGAVTLNAWNHVAVTYDRQNVKFYVNGVAAGTTAATAAITTSALNLFIGEGSETTNRNFNGSIDEVKIYNRVLLPEEIRTHYLRGSGFGASGAITADKFRVVNTSGSKIFEVNQTGATIAPGGNQRLTIDSSGNVGIGKIKPNYKLDVAGTINASGLHVDGNLNVTGTATIGNLNISGISFTGGNLETKNITADNIDLRENMSLYMPVYGTDDGLVLYLPFSENAVNVSNKTYDRSPYGNDGLLVNMNIGNATNGTGWANGKYGNALSFDGVNDYMQLPLSIPKAKVEAEGMSWGAWIKTTSTQASIIRQSSDGAGSQERGGGLGITAGKFYYILYPGTGGYITALSTTTVNDNAWHYVFATFSTDLKMSVYVDGRLEDIETTVGAGDTVVNMIVGKGDPNNPGTIGYFDGTIDEVMVYKRALAPEEIRTHYLRGSGFGASGAITADKFRVVNTSGSKIFEINQTGAAISPGGNQRLTIDSSGNVGIGTTAPATTLDVKGKANFTGNFSVGETSNILFVDNTSGYVGIGTTAPGRKLEVSGSMNATQLNISGAANLAYGSGRVGIGTTTPAALLQVGSNSIEGDIVLMGTTPTIWLNETDTTGGYRIDNLNGVFNIQYVDDAGSASGNAGLTVNVDKVGIGTNAPLNTLHVNGTGAQGGFRVTNESGQNVFFVNSSSGNVGIGTAGPGAKLDVLGNIALSSASGDTDMFIYTNDSHDFLQLSTGGTTGDIARLEIYGAEHDHDADGFALVAGTGGDVVIAEDTGSTQTRLIVKATTGNVGIGKTNPNYKLDVAGTINASGLLLTNGTFSVGTNGRIGIGTSEPSSALVVVGNASFNRTTGGTSINFDTTNNAILFTGENGSLYQPVYGTDDGLVLYLPFSEGNASMGSTRVYDRSPYGNDGTCNGVDSTYGCNWTTGKYGNALQFDGADDYVNVGNSLSLDITGSITLEAWIKPLSPSDTGTYISKRDGGNNANYLIRINTDKTISFYWYNGDWQGFPASGSIAAITNWGEWNYIVATYVDGGTAKIYVNSVLRDSIEETTGMLANTANVIIGAGALGASQRFNGTIDEVRIYNRALSPEEIRTHYLRGSGFGASGAVTADKFRVVNTSGSKIFEINQTGAAISPGGNQRLTIDSSGNVGIGTTAPTEALVVAGNANVTGNLTLGGDGSGSLGVGQRSLDFSFGDLVVGDFETGTGISANAKTVAIGFRPSSGITRGRLDFTGGAATSVNIGDSWKWTVGTLTSDGTAGDYDSHLAFMNTIRNGATDTARMVISTEGNVGIGNTAPGRTLEVSGSINGTQLNISGPVNLAYGSGSVGIGTAAPATLLDVKGKANFTGNFSVGETSNILFVDNTSGRVGIGTTNPYAKLQTAGEIRISQTNSVVGSTPKIQFSNDAGATARGYITGDAYTLGDVVLQKSNDGAVLLNPTDGSVGIGTTAPYRALQINGSGVSLETNNSAYFAIRGGMVGINTTAPTKALHSIGEFNLSAAGVQREVATNQTCVLIKGQTSTLEIC